MGQLLYESYDKLDTIIAQLEALYTHSISSQTDMGDYIKFTLSAAHNIQLNGVIKISGVVDDEGAAIEDYNKPFEVYSVPDPTSVVVAKDQIPFAFELTYNGDAVFGSAEMTNARLYNDPGYEFPSEDYPIIVVDVDDTVVIREGYGLFIPDETLYPITVLHRLSRFEEGAHTQLKNCRRFVSYKLQEILDELNLKVVANVGRIETVWGSEEVSIAGTTVIK